MCGIVGLSGGYLERLEQAAAALAHRGPDDSGLFMDRAAGVGLGHRRLSILDLSPTGHQPMPSSDGRVRYRMKDQSRHGLFCGECESRIR